MPGARLALIRSGLTIGLVMSHVTQAWGDEPGDHLANMSQPYHVLERVRFCAQLNNPQSMEQQMFRPTPETKEWNRSMRSLEKPLIRWSIAYGYSLSRLDSIITGTDYDRHMWELTNRDNTLEQARQACTDDLARVRRGLRDTLESRYAKQWQQERNDRVARQAAAPLASKPNDQERAYRWCAGVSHLSHVVLDNQSDVFGFDRNTEAGKAQHERYRAVVRKSEEYWEGEVTKLSDHPDLDISSGRRAVDEYYQSLSTDNANPRGNEMLKKLFIEQELYICDEHSKRLRKRQPPANDEPPPAQTATVPDTQRKPQSAADIAAEGRNQRKLAAARQMALAEEIQAVSVAHLEEQQRQFNDFMARIQTAATDAERAALQRQLRESQATSNAELQKKVAAIKAAHRAAN